MWGDSVDNGKKRVTWKDMCSTGSPSFHWILRYCLLDACNYLYRNCQALCYHYAADFTAPTGCSCGA